MLNFTYDPNSGLYYSSFLGGIWWDKVQGRLYIVMLQRWIPFAYGSTSPPPGTTTTTTTTPTTATVPQDTGLAPIDPATLRRIYVGSGGGSGGGGGGSGASKNAGRLGGIIRG